MKTVPAVLHIQIAVQCPNEQCLEPINILNEMETYGVYHDDGGTLLRQVLTPSCDHEKFKCDYVTCTDCGTVFNVEGLQ